MIVVVNRISGQIFSRLIAAALLAGVAACAVTPVEETPVSGNAAVLQLAAAARDELAAGNAVNAAAKLERALRIEPRSARLWYELARVRLSQDDARQAENLALRANGYAGEDRRLRSAIWNLIGEARQRQGNEAGARAAFEKATQR
jgi:cytochrome c-type biogenesis protein CcmH/NrfG